MAQKQIIVSMPKEWLEQLEQMASSYSHKNVARSRLQLFRDALKGRISPPAIGKSSNPTPVKEVC